MLPTTPKIKDLDKERSLKSLTKKEFLTMYNHELPDAFPKASLPLLEVFKHTHPELFKRGAIWSLDQHRKRFMDWLPNHLRAQQE